MTDSLGWACERAAGRRLSELISELLWRPMGAEHAACITVDRIGGMRAAGGICTTARDLARLGLPMARGGRRDDRQVIPGAWLRDIVANADPQAWAMGDFAEEFAGHDMAYRSKWYVRRGDAPLEHGQGIHGQYLFADAARDLSVALMSSQADPVDLARTGQVFDLVAALRAAL